MSSHHCETNYIYFHHSILLFSNHPQSIIYIFGQNKGEVVGGIYLRGVCVEQFFHLSQQILIFVSQLLHYSFHATCSCGTFKNLSCTDQRIKALFSLGLLIGGAYLNVAYYQCFQIPYTYSSSIYMHPSLLTLVASLYLL